MNKEQAIEILKTAVKIAQSKGAYLLEDAKLIAIAIEILDKSIEPKQEPKIEQKEEVKKEEIVVEDKKEETVKE